MVQELIQLFKNKLEKYLCLMSLHVLYILFQVGFFPPWIRLDVAALS